jgi:hypothetical protein
MTETHTNNTNTQQENQVKKAGRPKGAGHWQELISNGLDNFIVSTHEERKCVSQAFRIAGIKIKTKRFDDGYRIWRVK